MAKKAKQSKRTQNTIAEAFTFGDPSPVLEGRDILGLVESWWNGKWYEPPISRPGLAKSFNANPHHSSAIYVKRNILVSSYMAHPLLSKQEFSRLVLDYLIFGDAYLQRVNNRMNGPLKLKTSPSKYTRRGQEDRFWYVPNLYDAQEFDPGTVFQLQEPDFNQELYGVPEYIAGLNSAWLNESATLFRRKYYQNGSHAGFILYMSDAAQEEGDIDALRKALKESKGPGNFRNLFMYAPNGQKDGIQIIPISEVQAKDEFFNIKNVTRDDVLAVHRVPPHLMGIIPTNTSGFGSVQDAAKVFNRNEIVPLQERFKEINDWLEIEVIRFAPYAIEETAA
ncbi:phage portal protein [Sedimenticola hydrogenitrophicus]|uniref:phage portal protein n=1 Tax=Sedimenticola hydrogenitrophicus TaxID=2967975 RepID=UPI0023B058B8|nr:phage portal protein [Sedimenticola hydrogenitrophicus]